MKLITREDCSGFPTTFRGLTGGASTTVVSTVAFEMEEPVVRPTLLPQTHLCLYTIHQYQHEYRIRQGVLE